MSAQINSPFAARLKAMKQKLDEKAMSLLIGAGFSKNFNKDVFPSWWELIFDMVREGLETELSDRFRQLHPRARAKGKAYEQFLKDRIEKHIENVGPLEAVSEFIRRKGYREAVDVRIEKKTPFIDIANGIRHINYTSNGRPERRPAKPDELRIHQKLVALPWNNIYTTNYDNLLETSVDVTIGEEFARAIKELSAQIEEEQIELATKRVELATLDEEIALLQDRLSKASATVTGLPSDPGIGVDEKKLKELIFQRARLAGSISILEDAIKSKDGRLADLKRKQNQVNSQVTYSSQLALKKNGNIIKLHGSVRTGETDPFGFDNDARMHYVISKEDFEGYPAKHEAFTQLMRIALLQESFCLLGFSGTDPNFLAWIGWVRDVIERKKSTEDGQEEKIYLIDVRDKAADPERVQFYNNHRIAFIPLAHTDCLAVLEEATGKKLPPDADPRELVELFLDYLSIGVMPNQLKIGYEVFQQEQYMRLWQRFAWKHTPDGKLNNFFLFESDGLLKALRKYNRIPANAYQLNERYDILALLDLKLAAMKDDPPSLDRLIAFSTQILEEQGLGLKNIFGDSLVFYDLLALAEKSGHRSYPMLLLIEMRDAVWANDEGRVQNADTLLSGNALPEIRQERQYLRALYACFNLRFSEAQNILAAWEPEAHWIMKKAGLVLLTSPDAALHLLRGARQDTIQETVYQLQMTAFASRVVSRYADRTALINQVNEITQEGLRDADHNLDAILERLNRHEEKIVPYGHDRFVTSHSINFGGGNEWALAQIFFRLLAELGFPLSVNGIPFKAPAEIHEALLLALRSIPYPALFYLFQYTDENFVMKLAQDYTANDGLDPARSRVFGNIRKMFLDTATPYYFRQNGLVFLSELINVIPPDEWEPFFNEVWAEQLKANSLFIERHHQKNHFIDKGLRLVQTPETASRVINDTLMYLIQSDPGVDQGTPIRYLYELNFNGVLKIKGEQINNRLDAAAIKTLTDAVAANLELLFVLGNISFALSEAQRQSITAELRKVDDLNSGNERIWRIILYFATDDPALVSKIKSAILRNPRLWDAGFTEQGVGGTNNYISLYQLGLTWDEEELILLYEKLKTTLGKVEGWLAKYDHFSDFKAILEEMRLFLSSEKGRLDQVEDYQHVLGSVITLLLKEKGYETRLEGLLSSGKEAYIFAQQELFRHLYNDENLDEFEIEIETILNKVLLQVGPGLDEAFGTIIDWFYAFRQKNSLARYGGMLLRILEQYHRRVPKTFDLPFLESKLMLLADTLRTWGYQEQLIGDQLELVRKSRYMTSRFNVLPII